jgi:DNA-binding MarR family transcriptional regulator
METSRLAFESIQDTLGQRQIQVITALEQLKSANNREIAEFLRMPINSITPRVLELRDKKLITVSKVDKDLKTNRQTIYWQLTKFGGQK